MKRGFANQESFLDELMNLPSVYNGKRSPDGKYVAFNIINLHPNLDVFYTDILPSNTVNPITKTSEFTILYNWWPDSKSVLIGQDIGRDERITLFQVFLDNLGQMEPLTRLKPDFFLRTPSISPDGKNLYYFANYDFSGESETEVSHLFRHTLEDQSIELLTSPIKPAYNQAFLNLKGNFLIYDRSDIKPGGYQWWLIREDGSDDREILNFGADAKLEASWLPNSEQIVFITDRLENEQLQTRLTGIFNIYTDEILWLNKSGESVGQDLSHHDFSKAYTSRYDPEKIVLIETKRAKSLAYFYDLRTHELIAFPRLPGTLWPIQNLPNGRWMGAYYSSTQPNTYVTFSVEDLPNLTTDQFHYYFNNFAHSKVQQSHLVPAEELEWKSQDGTLVHGWVYQTKEPTQRAILYIHGGPTGHSEDRLNSEIQYYVTRGFNVLDPNYRGSTGYGVTFRDSIKIEGWGGAEQTDIAKGAEKLIEMGLAKKRRIGITGTSFGGYSAWCMITKFPEIFGASAPVCGMTDLFVDYKTTRPDLRPYSAEMMGGTPAEVPERYREGSPINYIQNIKGKILIVQGMRDPNVTPENVRVVEEKLNSHNISYEKLAFDNEGHGITRKENRFTKILRITEFFRDSL